MIAKSVEKEFDTPDAAVAPEEPETSDKFDRLNLFFEHQKVSISSMWYTVLVYL